MPEPEPRLVPEPESPWCDRESIARRYGVSPRCITNWQKRRRIPYAKLGRVVRFDVHACDRAVKAMEVKSIACLAFQNPAKANAVGRSDS